MTGPRFTPKWAGWPIGPTTPKWAYFERQGGSGSRPTDLLCSYCGWKTPLVPLRYDCRGKLFRDELVVAWAVLWYHEQTHKGDVNGFDR